MAPFAVWILTIYEGLNSPDHKVFSSQATHCLIIHLPLFFLCFYHLSPTLTKSRSTMFFQSVLKALLAVSLAASGVHATDNNLEDTERFRLTYGHCYKLTSKNGEVLGHQPDDSSSLQFAQDDEAIFKLCENIGECTVPNSRHQDLRNHARFWLFDTKTNSPFTKNGGFIGANPAPSGGRSGIYPTSSEIPFYVNFWGENQCRSTRLGKCAVKLHVDNQRANKELVIDSSKALLIASDVAGNATVTFNEVDCPN